MTRRARILLGTSELRDPLLLVIALALAPLVLDDFRVISVGSFLPLAIAALGLSVVWGYCGILSLGQAAFFALGAYGAALGIEHWGAWRGTAGGLLLGVLVAALLAYAIGRFAFGFRVDPFYIAVISFAVAVVFQQLLLKFSGFTGGFNGVVLAETVLPLEPRQAYYVALAVFSFVLLMLVALTRSDSGRLIVAVRDNTERLRFLGGDVDRIQRRVFVVGAAVTAIGGALAALYNEQITPDQAGFLFSTQILIWTAIGGRTSLVGAAIGALAVNIGEAELSERLLDSWHIALGLAFIVVVLFVPDGLYSTLKTFSRRFERQGIVELAPARTGESPPGEVDRPLLAGDDLVQRFGPLTAVDVDHLELNRHEVCALIGPNGAGKTTLVGMLSGELPPLAGRIRFAERETQRLAPHELASLGLRRKFQAPNVFESLTVAENLWLGARRATGGAGMLRRTRRAELPEAVLALLDDSGLRGRLGDVAADLSHGERQWLELCVVLARQPDAVLLDEPTAGLSARERSDVGRVLRSLAGRGLAILLIEHDFDFVREVADRVIVMHQGRVIADGTIGAVAADATVRAIYLGSAT